MNDNALQPTNEERELVAILAGNGIPQRTVCRFVKRDGKSISLSTLKRYFRAELDEGREISDAQLVHKAYEVAMDGNPQMLIFLAKTRLGWKEPAQEINLRQTYEELVKKSFDLPKVPPVLQVVSGGKT